MMRAKGRFSKNKRQCKGYVISLADLAEFIILPFTSSSLLCRHMISVERRHYLTQKKRKNKSLKINSSQKKNQQFWHVQAVHTLCRGEQKKLDKLIT